MSRRRVARFSARVDLWTACNPARGPLDAVTMRIWMQDQKPRGRGLSKKYARRIGLAHNGQNQEVGVDDLLALWLFSRFGDVLGSHHAQDPMSN
jgi:hypothetical protein